MNITKEVEVQHKAILFTLNQRYRDNMTHLELYEETRGVWVLGEKRERAEYAMAVYKGIVLEVYRVDRWHPACTLEYKKRKDVLNPKYKSRWEFEGRVANEIRDLYVGFSVGKGGQNPIRYTFK